VERSNLDAQLAYQAVRAGAELHDGEPVTNVNRGEMRTKTGTYRARVIIGADGANSLVARLSGLGLPLRGIALETVVSWNGPGERILVELGTPPGGTPGSFRAPGEKLR
jgi:flavin-dependent dehydrogenase